MTAILLLGYAAGWVVATWAVAVITLRNDSAGRPERLDGEDYAIALMLGGFLAFLWPLMAVLWVPWRFLRNALRRAVEREQ